MPTMTQEEYDEESATLRQGRYLCIENKDRKWWSERLRSGFFAFLEDDDQPVKVVHNGQTFYFGGGLERKQVYSFMRSA